jgi:hypothetical protein
MGEPACVNERKVRLSDVFAKSGTRAEYTYDFGDSWEHAILVEKILTPEDGLTYPLCTDGKLHGQRTRSCRKSCRDYTIASRRCWNPTPTRRTDPQRAGPPFQAQSTLRMLAENSRTRILIHPSRSRLQAWAGPAHEDLSSQVLMIEGSPYNKLVAINDAPLSKQQQDNEEQRLKREMKKREHESPTDRQRRVAAYVRERNHDHAMLSEMTKAFQYTLTGEDMLDGRKVWVLEAAPKSSYIRHSREAKVLRHMRGNLWIDQATYQ